MPEYSAPIQEIPEDATGAPEAKVLVTRIVHWARTSRLRMVMSGSAAFLLLAAIFAAWSYLAHRVIRREYPTSLRMALYALDVQQYDKAKDIVAQMRRRSDRRNDLGGALFVLGAVKAHQSESEWSADRRRAMYLMAARYLQKSLVLGIPAARETQARYLLGLSLIRGNQPQSGIAELLSVLQEENISKYDVHRLLTDAYQALPTPDWEAALEHNRILLSDETLGKADRAEALLTQVEILGKQGHIDEALQQLDAAEALGLQRVRIKSLAGQLALQSALNYPPKGPQRLALIDQALANFDEAKRLDPHNGELLRQIAYWIGNCHEAQGDTQAALKAYDRLSKQHGNTAETLAATLAKANLDQILGNAEQALAGYRLVLETVGEPVTYVNRLLPFAELKKRLEQAHSFFVEAGQFEHSIALVDQFQPVFDLIEVAQLRGRTHERWGRNLLQRASEMQGSSAPELVKQGRYHLRAAGSAYESLAPLRFATRDFTDDLWRAAENYFQGHSFTHASRVLAEFLHYEAERHQAMALLRLGQSLLAIGQTKKAAATLEECLELYPRNSVVFQARLDCFQAHLQNGNYEAAKELLLTNLNGGSLKPKSPEWRDSLFALGEFYHNQGAYTDAIKTLDEAVRRYPEAPQTLMARYTLARSYHNASKKPAEIARTARTENKRQKNRKIRDSNLEQALQNYRDVQRWITVRGHNSELEDALLRNCSMMQGAVLFQLKRFPEARKAYANISTLHADEPFVMESFIHVANCWRRLDQPVQARGTLEQAKLVLQRFPKDTDFQLATNFNRDEWKLLLNELSAW
ncbi:MAG: tetratricopeptide repeat protein [Pirellulales bacterium]|nr:tetratricopeptide repeat protein [Pirellulales bacterium]